MAQLNSEDYAIVFVFSLLTVLFPFFIGYLIRDKSFLEMTFAGRNLGFVSMALTMFLSKNGAAQLTGLAGWAVHSGLGIYAYELVGCFGLLTLGWIFMPVYMASGVNTTIDYANKRFGGKRIGVVMVILMLFINLLSKFSVELHIAHTMIHEMYGLPPIYINIIMIIGALIIVYPGGLYSLVYTNNLQFIFFVVGIPVIFVFSYNKFTSWQEIQLRYQKAWPNTTIISVRNGSNDRYTHCGIPDLHSLDLIRNHNDQDLPWPGMIFGIYIISLYNFCIDQSILQYCLGAKNIVNAKEACILSSFFKILTIFMVIPGFIARVLFTDTVACADPDICDRACGKRSGCADLALPELFEHVVPQGWRGPVLVAFMAATLTSLAATFHAGSTIFVLNLYRPLRYGQTSEFECRMVSKGVEIVQAFFGILLVSAIDTIPKMHDFMQQIYSTMVPPLVAVYVTGIFWDKVTEANAFRALVLGSCIAFTRLFWKISYGFIPCGDETRVNVPEIIANFHDLHFAVFLFVICACFIIISGSMTDAIHEIHLHRLIFWKRHDIEERLDINLVREPFLKNDVTLTSNAIQAIKSTILGAINSTEKSTTTASEKKPIMTNKDKDKGKNDQILESDLDQAYEAVHPVEEPKGEEPEQEEKEEKEIEKRATTWDVFSKYVAFSQKQIRDEDFQEPMSSRTLVKELPSQTQTLNMMLVVLLLAIVFVMGFFK